MPPSGPFSQTLANSTFTSSCSQSSFNSVISLSVSLINSLIATTTGNPYLRILRICLAKLLKPFFNASRFSILKSALAIPPCIFSALIVATITTASGAFPKLGTLISKNFSPPRSAPKPASVTT